MSLKAMLYVLHTQQALNGPAPAQVGCDVGPTDSPAAVVRWSASSHAVMKAHPHMLQENIHKAIQNHAH